MFDDFNARNGHSSRADSDYSYQRNPMHMQSFTILKRADDDHDFAPIGNYTVLDQTEPPLLSEKKVINLIALLNGSDQLVDLGTETQSRLLFQMVSHDGPPDQTKVMFYTLGEQGMSRENALLSLNERIADAH